MNALTAPQRPWQNAYAERWIGSIRRECLNHFIILNACHFKTTLAAHFRYHHESRPHLALEKQCPIERQIIQHGAILTAYKRRHKRPVVTQLDRLFVRMDYSRGK